VSYDMHAHRDFIRTNLLRLVAAGPGWHDYAREEARRLVQEDPTLHGDLLEAVKAEIAKQVPQQRRIGAQITTRRT